MNTEKNKIIHSMLFPAIFLLLMWLVKIFEVSSGIDLKFLGIYPLKTEGLIGIITSPLIHSNFSHLSANSLPILILGTAIFYFYRGISFQVFFLIYFLSGLWLWFGGREAHHIGASGLIYGMGSFLFVSGIIRRDTRLLAVSLIVIFAYGSLIWGIFPDFFPDKRISWEGHLMGLISGVVLAIFYRKSGPQRKIYSWEFEEEYEDDDDQEISSHHLSNSDSIEINYHYRKKEDKEEMT